MKIIVTGGCGFIGSALIKSLCKNKKNSILNIDNLTEVSSKESLKTVKDNKNYSFKNIDIANYIKTKNAIKLFKPNIIINCAAESHVDNSISYPKKFIETNIIGTYNLLESIRLLNKKIIFFHVSTDELYGSLKIGVKKFNEKNKHYHSSPYLYSKDTSID